MNENLENDTKPIIENKQDAQRIQNELIEKKNQIIEAAPKLFLAIRKAPYYLGMLFEKDGTPRGDFTVTEKFKRKIALALKHPHHKSTTGEMYFGELTDQGSLTPLPNEYVIQATPTFLTEEELKKLAANKRLIKKIGNAEVELIPYSLHSFDFSSRVESYIDGIRVPREKVNKINEIISEIDKIKAKLPEGTREVIIENFEDNGYPHR